MAPIIPPVSAGNRPLRMRIFDNTSVAGRAVIAARSIPDFSREHPIATTTTIVAMIIVFGLIFLFLTFRGIGRSMSRRPPPAMPSGHVYGHDEAGSHALTTLSPQRSGERPYAREIENRQSGGAVSGGPSIAPFPIEAPVPVLSRTSQGQDESPPPCKHLLDNLP